MAFQLVALTFIRSHVATARILWIGAWHTTLIRLQQMTVAVGTATRVASINRWAAGEKSLRLCRAAVVLQGAQHRVDVVHIAGAIEFAAAIAAEIVAIRGHCAGAVASRIIRNNAVLQRRCAAVNDTVSKISANGAAIHSQGPRDDATRVAARFQTAVGAISGDGAVVQRQCAAGGVECPANTHLAGGATAACSADAIAGESTVLNHQQRAHVVDATAKSRASSFATSARIISADDAVADGQRARIVNAPT